MTFIHVSRGQSKDKQHSNGYVHEMDPIRNQGEVLPAPHSIVFKSPKKYQFANFHEKFTNIWSDSHHVRQVYLRSELKYVFFNISNCCSDK